MSNHPIPGWLRSQFSRIEDEVQKLGPCGVFTQMRTVTQTYFEQQAKAPQPQKEPVVWGAPKTVRQLIGQLETLDPELETVALYRLPDGLGKLSGKVKQGHISTSYERMEGIWLGPYKGDGRKVLAFWTKIDPRPVPDGELLTQTPPLGGDYDYRTDLACYFGLSYASWLTIPRVLMEAMPDDWQVRMAALLHEYDDAMVNPPNLGTTVRVTVDGKMVTTPKWLVNYRHPDRQMIAHVFGRANPPDPAGSEQV